MPTTTNPARPTLITLPTSALRPGMVVRNHGYRMTIESELKLSRCHREDFGGVHYGPAVLDPDQDRSELDPFVVRMADRGDDGSLRWSIQGNDLATWCVEADSVPQAVEA